MGFNEWWENNGEFREPTVSERDSFEAGQQSKQAEIDALKSKVQELWTEMDDRQSKEHIIERCELIIQELLK